MANIQWSAGKHGLLTFVTTKKMAHHLIILDIDKFQSWDVYQRAQNFITEGLKFPVVQVFNLLPAWPALDFFGVRSFSFVLDYQSFRSTKVAFNLMLKKYVIKG